LAIRVDFATDHPAAWTAWGILLGIPTKKIAHSELMTIKPSPSDAVRDILE